MSKVNNVLIHILMFFACATQRAYADENVEIVLDKIVISIIDQDRVGLNNIPIQFKSSYYSRNFIINALQEIGSFNIRHETASANHYLLEVEITRLFRVISSIFNPTSLVEIKYKISTSSSQMECLLKSTATPELRDSLNGNRRVQIGDDKAVIENLKIFNRQLLDLLKSNTSIKPIPYTVDPIAGKLGVHNINRSGNIIQWDEIENTITTSGAGKVYRSRRSKNIGDCEKNLQATQSSTNFQRTEAQGRGDKVEDNLNIAFGADLKRICDRTEFKESIELKAIWAEITAPSLKPSGIITGATQSGCVAPKCYDAEPAFPGIFVTTKGMTSLQQEDFLSKKIGNEVTVTGSISSIETCAIADAELNQMIGGCILVRVSHETTESTATLLFSPNQRATLLSKNIGEKFTATGCVIKSISSRGLVCTNKSQ
jgi:hypothetical protein